MADAHKAWWLTSGPPSEPLRDQGTADSQAKPATETPSIAGWAISPEVQQRTIEAGFSLFQQALSLLNPALNQAESTHDVAACGVCPLCVAVEALRERDPALAELMESAMKGVTENAEAVVERFDDIVKALTETVSSAVVSAALSALLKRN